jgi:hypothetical protein
MYQYEYMHLKSFHIMLGTPLNILGILRIYLNENESRLVERHPRLTSHRAIMIELPHLEGNGPIWKCRAYARGTQSKIILTGLRRISNV